MKNALHFVGFKDDRVYNAFRVFGKPDFWHRKWDYRAKEEMMPGDWAVFADGTIDSPTDPYGYDDSAIFAGNTAQKWEND